MIVAEPEFADRAVCGAAVIKNEARVSVLGIPDRPGVSLQIFAPVAAKNVNVDMIVQNVGEKGLADISFTVPRNELAVTLESVLQAVEQLGAGKVVHDENELAAAHSGPQWRTHRGGRVAGGDGSPNGDQDPAGCRSRQHSVCICRR